MRSLGGLLILSIVIWATSVFAQTGEYGAADLAQCLIAQSQTLDQQSVLRSEASLSVSRARFLPTITGALSKTESFDRYSLGSEALTLSLDQKLFSGSALAGIDAAEAGLLSARAETLQRAYSNSLSALNQMVSIQNLREQKALLQIRSEAYKTMAKVLSESQRVGLSDSGDYLQASSSALYNTAEIERVDFEIKQAARIFSAQYGFDAKPLTDFEWDARSSNPNPADLPNLRSVRAQISQISLEKTQLERTLWPELSVQGSVSSARIVDFPSANARSADGTIRLVLDLSGLWGTSGQRRAYEGIRAQQESLFQRQIKLEQNEFDRWSDEIKLYETQLALLKQRLEMALRAKEVTQAKVRIGRVSFLELQASEDSAFSARQEYVRATNRIRQLRLQRSLATYFSKPASTRLASCALSSSAH